MINTKIQYFIKSVIFPLLIIFTLLQTPNFIITPDTKDLLRLFVGIFILYFAYFIPLYFFRNCFRWYIYLLFPIYLLSIITFYVKVDFKIGISHFLITLFLETSIYDKLDYLLSVNLSAIVLFLLSISLYFLIASRLPRKVNKKYSRIISIIALIVSVIIPSIWYKNPLTIFQHDNISNRLFPVKFFTVSFDAGKKYLNLKEGNRNASSIEILNTNLNNEQNIVVFALGETARYDRWGINGYEKNTTPLLSRIENLISFDSIYADGYQTLVSGPIIMTRSNVQNPELYRKEKSFIDCFNQFDYETVWIDSKFSAGTLGIDLFSNEVDTIISVGVNCCYKDENCFDEILVEKVKGIINSSSGKDLFILVHFIGSHWRYGNHYPEEYNHWKPSEKDNLRTSLKAKNKNQINNSYDNSILYTDYVLSKLIKVLDAQQKPSIMYYISDHGENIYDDNRNLILHANASISTQHVPLLFWYSDIWELKNSEKVKNLIANKSKYSMGSNTFHTLTDLCKINYLGQDSTKSLANKFFKSPPRMVITEYGIDSLNNLK